MLRKKDYELSALITRCGNRDVHKAIEQTRKAGLPVSFSRNGKLYFEMPDGTITDQEPEVLKNVKLS